VNRDLIAARRPPGLLDEASPAARADCDAQNASVASTLELIRQGRHEDGARLFMEPIAFGSGACDQLPEPVRDTFAFNAPVFGDEQADPDWSCLELAELAATGTPLQLTYGSITRPCFREIVEVLARRLPQRPPAAHRRSRARPSPHPLPSARGIDTRLLGDRLRRHSRGHQRPR